MIKPILTKNDLSVMAEIIRTSREFDGFIPHGASNWTAIRRLEEMGFVKPIGTGVCADGCDLKRHEGPIYVLTDAGKAVAA